MGTGIAVVITDTRIAGVVEVLRSSLIWEVFSVVVDADVAAVEEAGDGVVAAEVVVAVVAEVAVGGGDNLPVVRKVTFTASNTNNFKEPPVSGLGGFFVCGCLKKKPKIFVN